MNFAKRRYSWSVCPLRARSSGIDWFFYFLVRRPLWLHLLRIWRPPTPLCPERSPLLSCYSVTDRSTAPALHVFTANNIFMAMWREALKTSVMDCLPIFGSLVKVAVGILVLGSGNPLIWGGAWYFNKRRKAMTEEWENQKRLQEFEEKKRKKLGQ